MSDTDYRLRSAFAYKHGSGNSDVFVRPPPDMHIRLRGMWYMVFCGGAGDRCYVCVYNSYDRPASGVYLLANWGLLASPTAIYQCGGYPLNLDLDPQNYLMLRASGTTSNSVVSLIVLYQLVDNDDYAAPAVRVPVADVCRRPWSVSA